MWQKDENGEWFVEGIVAIPEGSARTSSWNKDENGTWYQSLQVAFLKTDVRLGLAG
jgi:hypothetical protein